MIARIVFAALVLAMAGHSAAAKPRGHSRPHHHLVKHARALDVHVVIPRAALTAKPRAVHQKRRRR